MMASVPLQRLQSLASSERSLYAQLYASVGGDPSSQGQPAPSGATVDLLRRSRLPQDALRSIWQIAARDGQPGLDFEAFCVACRLCAHAQRHGVDAVLGEPGSAESAAAEAPQSPPWFEGAPGSDNSVASSSTGCRGGAGSSAAAQPAAGFDFEAMAFGVDGAAAGQPSGPPAPLSAGDMAMMSGGATGVGASLSDGVGRYGRSGAASDFPLAEDDVEEDTGLSSHKVAEVLAAAPGGEGSGFSHPPTERLGRELLERRRGLDQRLSGKIRREAEVEEARRRLEDLRTKRRSASVEHSARQAEVERLVTRLSFQWRRIEETEREVTTMREVRGAFGQEELARLVHKFGDLTKTGSADNREAAKKNLQLASKDTEGSPELRDRVQRVYRKRADLQARQQLLVAGQVQAERERIYGRKALEVARGELVQLQTGRLRAHEEKLSALEAASKLAKDLGVGPGVVEELFHQAPPGVGSSTRGGAAASGPPRSRRTPVAPAASQMQAPDVPSQGGLDWRPPQQPSQQLGEVASWWRAMLAAPPDAAMGVEASAKAARERVTPQHPPMHWAAFGAGAPVAARSDSEAASTPAFAAAPATAPALAASTARRRPVEMPSAFCAT